MDYKNLYIRFLSSIFFILLLFFSILFLENYFYLLITIIYLFIVYEIINNFTKNLFFLIILYTYLFITFVSFQMYIFYFYDRYLFVSFILIIIFFDSSSYIFGSLFGKTKILPKLSPGKTYFGFFSGFFFTLILSFFFNLIFQIFDHKNFLLFTLLIILFSFFGDIIESYFKRKFSIKDSSNLIPGHGGFFDRFDGFITCSIPLIFYNLFF